ncbi:hypothetical protein SeMB42_g07973, partial [Synchytrium endobioticum]
MVPLRFTEKAISGLVVLARYDSIADMIGCVDTLPHHLGWART